MRALVLAVVLLAGCVGPQARKDAASVADKSAELVRARFACQAKINPVINALNPDLTCDEARAAVITYMRGDEDCVQVLGAGTFTLECTAPDGGK